jgi:hypothetical protein
MLTQHFSTKSSAIFNRTNLKLVDQQLVKAAFNLLILSDNFAHRLNLGSHSTVLAVRHPHASRRYCLRGGARAEHLPKHLLRDFTMVKNTFGIKDLYVESYAYDDKLSSLSCFEEIEMLEDLKKLSYCIRGFGSLPYQG